MNFPTDLYTLELSPLWFKERARDVGGFTWETDEADPVWGGRASTPKLNIDRQQRWEAFVSKVVQDRLVIQFVDPFYYIPAAYRGIGLPGAWDGVAVITGYDAETGAPLVGGLPDGFELRDGDRLEIRDEVNSRYHMMAEGLVVDGDDPVPVRITPAAFSNVFDVGAEVVFLNPAVRLHIVANSWKLNRVGRQEPIGSFEVEEAGGAMKSYSAAVEAQLAAGKIYRRRAIRFDLPSGSYGFVLGMAGRIEVDDVLYVGSGGLIEISEPVNAITDAAKEMTVTLASHRKVNGQVMQVFDPHLLDTIENEIWYLRPAIIYRFWFSSGRVLEDVEQMHLRQIFTVEHKRSRIGRRVEARLQTPAALGNIYEGKRNGPELQRLIDPTDTGLDDAILTGADPIYWGQRAPAPGAGIA